MKKIYWAAGAFVILALVILVLLATCNGSQKTAILSGKVVDNNKRNPVGKAIVKVGDAQATTDDNGSFKLEGIEIGKASIFVTADGFKPFEFGDYDFKDGQNTIDELVITPEDKTASQPDKSEIIPQPPMPGTKLDKVPGFKKLEKFDNCVVTFIQGDVKVGNGSIQYYVFNNGLVKLSTPATDPSKNSNTGADMYITDKKMIIHPSDEIGWISTDRPPTNPKMGEITTPDTIVLFFYKSVFKNIIDKVSTVTSGGKTKIDGVECNKYYVVSDANGNLIDGEFYTPTSGKYKDYLIKYVGRIVINGDGNRREISISKIGSAPNIVLPTNIKDIPKPKQDFPQPTTPPQMQKHNP